MKKMGVLQPEQGGTPRSYVGTIALLKPLELMRTDFSQLKTLYEANYAAFILKHMRVPVCQEMIQIAILSIGANGSKDILCSMKKRQNSFKSNRGNVAGVNCTLEKETS